MFEVIDYPELPFAILCIVLSFFSQRNALVFSRGGMIDQDLLSLILGFIANFIWIVSVIWFFLEGEWLIPILVIVLSLFGFNLLARGQPALWQLRNLIRVMAIMCGAGMWHSHYLGYF